MNPVISQIMKKTPYLSQFDKYIAEAVISGKSLASEAERANMRKDELIRLYSHMADKVSRLSELLFPIHTDSNETKVQKCLKLLGFHMPAPGVRLLQSAILFAMENPSLLDRRAELFLMVSKESGISPNTVRSRISFEVNAAVGRFNALPTHARPEFYQVCEIQEMIRYVNIVVFIKTFLSYMKEQQQVFDEQSRNVGAFLRSVIPPEQED